MIGLSSIINFIVDSAIDPVVVTGVDPVVATGVALTLIISVLGFFLTRMVRQNDKTNDLQDTHISEIKSKIGKLDTRVQLNTQADELKIGPLKDEVKAVSARMDGFQDTFQKHVEKHVSIKFYVDEELQKLREEIRILKG